MRSAHVHGSCSNVLPYPNSAPLMFFRASLRKPFEYSSSSRLRSYIPTHELMRHSAQWPSNQAYLQPIRNFRIQPADLSHAIVQSADRLIRRERGLLQHNLWSATAQAPCFGGRPRFVRLPGVTIWAEAYQHGRVFAAIHCHD